MKYNKCKTKTWDVPAISIGFPIKYGTLLTIHPALSLEVLFHYLVIISCWSTPITLFSLLISAIFLHICLCNICWFLPRNSRIFFFKRDAQKCGIWAGKKTKNFAQNVEVSRNDFSVLLKKYLQWSAFISTKWRRHYIKVLIFNKVFSNYKFMCITGV